LLPRSSRSCPERRLMRAVVVGSGAGGAVAARRLQGAFDVTVLEAGREFHPFTQDLSLVERLRSSRLFLDERMIRLLFPAMRVAKVADNMSLVYGVATGGTTTLATGNALRCDEALLERDIDLSPEFGALEAELPISAAHQTRWREPTKQLFAACADLGLGPQVTPKLVDYGRCRRCGCCVLGCPHGAKWDSRQYLDQAVDAGARLETGARVERVMIESAHRAPGRVTGVVVRRRGRRELVPADLVILAAGGLGTPAVLERSGIHTEPRLFVDPVLCVAGPLAGGHLDQEVPMPFVVSRDEYIISPYFDYLSFFFNRAWLRPRQDIVTLMIKLADTEAGSVDGNRVRKRLTERDHKVLAEATELCTEILKSVGIRRDEVFMGTLNAGHPGGTVPLSGEEREPLHADRLPENLYVADASLLPRSLGRPPMMTIMALAGRVAAVCRERFA
jgi:choline dehydrogenase-like flavoprotein